MRRNGLPEAVCSPIDHVPFARNKRARAYFAWCRAVRMAVRIGTVIGASETFP